MPDREVKTIQDLIFYQYAKIIVRSMTDAATGIEAKRNNYGIIKNKFRALKSGEISWSDILREDKQAIEAGQVCAYCGATESLQWEHIVPKSISIKPECKTCERILGIHNQVYACASCNGAHGKWNKGLYTFYKQTYPENKKFYDVIPPLVEKKYLKTIYYCHQCAGTLTKCDMAGDGELTVLDLDYPIMNFR
ncbi:MAG: HNH endonuclease [Sediminibacterium sp.]